MQTYIYICRNQHYAFKKTKISVLTSKKEILQYQRSFGKHSSAHIIVSIKAPLKYLKLYNVSYARAIKNKINLICWHPVYYSL